MNEAIEAAARAIDPTAWAKIHEDDNYPAERKRREVWQKASLEKANAAIDAAMKVMSKDAVAWECRFMLESGKWSLWIPGDGSHIGNPKNRPKEVRPLFAAPPAPAVQDGWKLVPVEPTLGQQSAALKYVMRQHQARDIYRAMMNAAPAPEAL